MALSSAIITRKVLSQVVRCSTACGWHTNSLLLSRLQPSTLVLASSSLAPAIVDRRCHYSIANSQLCTNSLRHLHTSHRDHNSKLSCLQIPVETTHSRGFALWPIMAPLAGQSSVQSRNSSFLAQKDTLPRLPVPELEETLQKFLKSARPLVTPEELSVTEKLVQDFVKPGGMGQKLQQYLVKKAASTENWMSDWWVDSAYFRFRMPVVVWSSPGLVFPLVEFKDEGDQLQYAAQLIAGALDYKNLLETDCIPIERMGATQLDMSQYFKIFSTCRIPGLTKDSVCYHMLDEDAPRHIVVLHNNHFFKLDVYGSSGQPLNVKQLMAQLESIVERSSHPAPPLGILSSQNRNVWGQAYKTLLKAGASNASHLTTLQRALFVLCLDRAVTPSTGNKMTDAALQCVHGGGSRGNAANRWFDKTIQFVVGRSGRVGLTYEHSPAEGPPIANLMDHIVSFMSRGDYEKLPLAADVTRPERLQFMVPKELEAEMDRASKVLDSLVDDLEMTCFNFTGFGKNFIKSQKISPDSFIQMAIQLAFYRIHKEPGAQYESGSTRQFLHGRTETIRSCSEESVAFCTAMLDRASSSKQRQDAMKAAVHAHKTYVQQAISGRGVDRHLLGLKLAATELGLDVPPLFTDVSYAKSSHMRISTSQVPAKCEAFMCYGPLVPDGYGCCYNPRSDSIVFGTSALHSSPETDSATFKAALEQSLMEMRDLCLTAKL